MRNFTYILLFLILNNCNLNKVVQSHGVKNLDKKQLELKVNYSNKYDILNLIGPPSSQSKFDEDLYIYIERKTSSSQIIKLGKKKLITNNVLILELDDGGILISKKFYNKENINNIKFDTNITSVDYNKISYINDFLFTLRQKIDDPLNKKRSKN